MLIRRILDKLPHPNPNIQRNREINKRIRRFIETKSNAVMPPRETVFNIEVLIPCYNHGRYLETALASILEGTSITVINDASTDDTKSIAEKLAKHFDFQLINNETNLNQAGSLNLAITRSSNNLFMVLNADDVLMPHAINTAYALYSHYPNIRLAGGSSVVFSDEKSLRFAETLPKTLHYIPAIHVVGPREAQSFNALNDILITMSGSSFLKSAWGAAGGFLPFKDRVCSYDDRDFQMRVCALFDAAVTEEPVSFYRTNSSTQRSQSV